MDKTMQHAILDYLRDNGASTLHDMELDIAGFAGEETLLLDGYSHVELWRSVSEPGITAFNALLKQGRIKVERVELIAFYFGDDAPIAEKRINQPSHDLHSPHWWPAAVSLRR
ncbi:hypothetical protein [Pseudoalteromonas sp. R3]|uniref:hypothetical protein n=1 Tax=Pseudoalteromonas sp. R3 TaxID=1709477 RepID=UPI0006B609D4|nr:hypothetical protein [Pseudoalteromonas sp. R3]AZZ97987.1 hypothetical protein ELR70_13210 [Pseudoalteromonas sp. R3]